MKNILLSLFALSLLSGCFETQLDDGSLQNANGVIATLRFDAVAGSITGTSNYFGIHGFNNGNSTSGNEIKIPLNACLSTLRVNASQTNFSGCTSITAGINLNGVNQSNTTSLTTSNLKGIVTLDKVVSSGDNLYVYFQCGAGSTGSFRTEVEVDLSHCN